jgi:hypothetical protein
MRPTAFARREPVPVYPMGAIETVTADGALSIASLTSAVESGAGLLSVTLADGVCDGHCKRVRCAVHGGGNITITPNSLYGGGSITLTAAGEFCELVWSQEFGAWLLVDQG